MSARPVRANGWSKLQGVEPLTSDLFRQLKLQIRKNRKETQNQNRFQMKFVRQLRMRFTTPSSMKKNLPKDGKITLCRLSVSLRASGEATRFFCHVSCPNLPLLPACLVHGGHCWSRKHCRVLGSQRHQHDQ